MVWLSPVHLAMVAQVQQIFEGISTESQGVSLPCSEGVALMEVHSLLRSRKKTMVFQLLTSQHTVCKVLGHPWLKGKEISQIPLKASGEARRGQS